MGFSLSRMQVRPDLRPRLDHIDSDKLIYEHRSSLLVFFKIWLSSDIDEMVATITLWNKVSPAFLNLNDFCSSADEG